MSNNSDIENNIININFVCQYRGGATGLASPVLALPIISMDFKNVYYPPHICCKIVRLSSYNFISIGTQALIISG